MIILTEVATKLEKILNGVDTEIPSGLTNPVNHPFVVETQGFHIDHIMEVNSGDNFIPVFISSMGGQFNPVKGLKQGSYVIPITFYYPVRFKDEFYELGDFLIEMFVGSSLNYGSVSGSAISNLSAPTFGEIIGTDLQEFERWEQNVFQKRVGVKTEPFMSMTLNLYLTNAGEGFIFGNAATVTLKYTPAGNTPETIIFSNSSVQSNAQSSNEQELDATTPEADGMPFGTAYGAGFTAYIKNDAWWRKVMYDWCQGKAQTMEFVYILSIKLDNSNNIVFTRTCYIESVNMPIQPGQLLTATFSFGKKVNLS